MHFNDRESVIALTPLWKGERLPDGRPKVADKYLDALYGMTLEEVWKPIFVLGYENQFVGGGEAPMQTLHDDGRKLVGRAVTCTFCPTRPDLHGEMFRRGGLGYGTAKTILFEKINSVLAEPRAEYERLMANTDELDAILQNGAKMAAMVAEKTMQRVKKAMLG